jgi:transcriptional regulator with XRE-family HTH domain
MKLSERVKNQNMTIYSRIACKHGVSRGYVGKIARGERIPLRGRGLKAWNELKKVAEEVTL